MNSTVRLFLNSPPRTPVCNKHTSVIAHRKWNEPKMEKFSARIHICKNWITTANVGRIIEFSKGANELHTKNGQTPLQCYFSFPFVSAIIFLLRKIHDKHKNKTICQKTAVCGHGIFHYLHIHCARQVMNVVLINQRVWLWRVCVFAFVYWFGCFSVQRDIEAHFCIRST